MSTSSVHRTTARVALAVLASTLVLTPTSASAAPQDAPLPASGTTVTGTIERVAVDHFDGTDSEITAVVPVTGDAVIVRADDVASVASGSLAEVTVGPVTATNQDIVGASAGAEVSDVDVLREGPTGEVVPGAGAPAPATTQATTTAAPGGPATAGLVSGARAVHLLTALLPGQSAAELVADGVTPETLASDITTEVAAYWSTSTGGAVSFTPGPRTVAGTYAGWGSTATCTNEQILAFLDWTAVRAGVYPAAHEQRHTVTYTPHLSACGFAGVAHVASGGSAWINGSQGVTPRADVVSHELGHTLTLGHSDARTACTTGADGAAAQCATGPYGDAYDVMGIKVGTAGLLNAAHLATLGLLDDYSTVTVPAGQTRSATLAAVDSAAGTRFVTFTSGGATYYVENRAAVGRDADLATTRYGWPRGTGFRGTRYLPGVIVHRVDKQLPGATSHLLGMTTGESVGFVLPVGATFTTADGARELRVQSTAGTTAQVEVVDRVATATAGGPPQTTAASGLVRTAADPSVYLVAGTVKYPITNLDLMAALSPLGPVRVLPQRTLDAVRTGPAFRRVVAAPDGTISFVDAGIRLPLTTCAQVADFGYGCADAIPLEAAQIARLHAGPAMPSLYRTTSGKAFYVTGGTRREITDTAALVERGLPTASVTLLESGIAYLPYGAPLTRDGMVLRSRTTGALLLSAGGLFTPLTQGLDRVPGIASMPVALLDGASLDRLAQSAPLAPIVRDPGTGRVYLLTTAGKVHLTDPATVAATPATTSVLPRVPDAGSRGATVFLKSQSDATVYYLYEGRRRPIGSWADVVTLDGGSASPVIHTLPGTSAALLPAGPTQVAPGTLVKAPGDATVYLTDGPSSRITVASFTPTTEIGATRLVVLSSADLAAYALAPGRITTAVACGTDRYLGLSGRLYRVTPTVETAYRITGFTTLDPSTCAALPRSAQALDRFLRTPDGTIYHVADGAKRPIASMASYAALGGTAATTVAITAATAALLPTGPRV